jgi:chromosome partitioning protein
LCADIHKRAPEGRVLAPRRVAFINEKGGSGKTTLASNFAAYLALHRGRRILAIDMDPQGQLGKVLGVEGRHVRRSAIDLILDAALGDPGLDRVRADADRASADPASTLPITRTRIDRLDLVAANKSLGLVPGWEEGDGEEVSGRLAAALDAETSLRRYDFVFFDGPPSFGPLTLCVLRAASEVVLPVPLTYLALDGCAELLRTVAMVRNRYDHPMLKISMVVPTFYRRTRLAHEVLEKLKARFPKEVAHTVVGFHVKIDEAQSRGLSIFEYAPRDRGASAMAELAEELEIRRHAGGGGEEP